MSQLTLSGAGPSRTPFFSLADITWALWLDAAQETYQDAAKTTPADGDGDPIGCWADLSGNGRDFSQGTADNKPTLQLSEINGLPVIQSDGSNDILLSTNFSSAESGTLILVYNLVMGDLYATVFSTADEGAVVYLAFYTARRPAAVNLLSMYGGVGQILMGNTPQTIAQTYIAAFSSDGTATRMWLDGASQIVNITGDLNSKWFADFAGRDNFALFGLKHTSTTYDTNKLAELLLAPDDLDDATLLTVFEHLADKYAIIVASNNIDSGNGDIIVS
ncbi:MAG: hypothetical protein WC565_07840 [Parcubacteria group bacterium]